MLTSKVLFQGGAGIDPGALPVEIVELPGHTTEESCLLNFA